MSTTSAGGGVLPSDWTVERDAQEWLLWMPESAFCGVSNSMTDDVLLLLHMAGTAPTPKEWVLDTDDRSSAQTSEKLGKGSSIT